MPKGKSSAAAEFVSSTPVGKGSRCEYCRDPIQGYLTEILEAMAEQERYAITRKSILAELRRAYPDKDLIFRPLEVHLIDHQSALWRRAKGRV